MRVLILAVLSLTFLSPAAFAQDHGHPPQDAQIHETFYSSWMRPDQPNISCCNNEDCAPAQAKMIGGQWWARKIGKTEWHKIPPEKIEHNRDSPDGRNHLCVLGGNVWCFITGGGV
jgi:hypothetical protein